MIKPDSLRAFLTTAVPALGQEADRLQIYIDKGTIRATGVPSAAGVVAFEYGYTCTLLLLDLAVHPDAVMVPLLAWISAHQPDLLQNHDKNRAGLAFEADILDAKKIDLQITVPLTERVGATPREGGGFDIVHWQEPAQAGVESWPDGPAEPPPATSIWHGDELIAEIPPPAPAP